MRIPPTSARTLTGLNVSVPDDFTGARNAVLLVFERHHLVAVPAWQAVLRQAVDKNPKSGFYVLIMGDDAPAWRRWLTEWALRLEITEPGLQLDTAVIWQDRQRWLAAAGWPATDEPLLTIASPDGAVHAVTPGMPRPGITSRLLDALDVD